MRQPSPKHGQENQQWEKIKQKSENGAETIKSKFKCLNEGQPTLMVNVVK